MFVEDEVDPVPVTVENEVEIVLEGHQWCHRLQLSHITQPEEYPVTPLKCCTGWMESGRLQVW